MKHNVVILLVIMFGSLTACGPTKEERAQDLAATYLKGILYHFDSYEPLQTTVDSSFVSLSTDKEAIDLAVDMLKQFQHINEYAYEIDKAQRNMEIWSYSISSTSAYAKGQYRRAKEDNDTYQEQLDKTKERIKNQFLKIKGRKAELTEGVFDGWRIYHKFKSLNGTGNVDMFGEFIFFCDAEFNETSAYPKDEYDVMSKILTIISESEDVSEMVDKIQELMM